jgi:hypothetical protein
MLRGDAWRSFLLASASGSIDGWERTGAAARMGRMCACAVKGALDQRVEVPPEEEVDPLGSYLAGTGGDSRTRSPETEGLERRSSEFAGRNVSEARAGPERAVVEADLAHIQGRPCVRREGRRSIAGRSTGVVGRGM